VAERNISSTNESLAQEFEHWQKQYFDNVDKHFAVENKPRGLIAFSTWEERFLSFLKRVAPNSVQPYQDRVKDRSLMDFNGDATHQGWKHYKGDAIEAFLTEAIQDARAGHIDNGQVAESSVGEVSPVKVSSEISVLSRKVFIGHGGSSAWRDLKDFLQDRLNIAWDEFNRESSAGITTKERLEAMLNQTSFAFLVMTAEDQHPDGTVHARENVIHEAGLFQGKLGFHRAILLVEEGCAEFSNITGLTQIRFPKGNILAKSEDIRRVLEREGLLK
jgi:predicted nucleotide-binding protein